MGRGKHLILATLSLLLTAAGVSYADTGVLDLNLKQNRYFGQPTAIRQGANYTFFSGDLSLEPTTSFMDFKLNPVAEGAFEGGGEFYFGVPELYLRPKNLGYGIGVVIGRQKRRWSRLDEEFNLGVWQPQLRFDYLQPKQEGLTGVFLDWSPTSTLRLSLFTSPVFLPDQGPNFQLQGGQFTSANRWFRAPQSQLSLFQGTQFAKDAPLYFELDRPAEEKIIMHPTIGLGVHYQSARGWFTDLNYAYKPRNQIHLGIECANCGVLGGAAPVEIRTVVHPVVVMHNVTTLESGFSRQYDRGWLSLSYDSPKASGLPADFEEAPLDSMMIAGFSYQHFLPPVLIPASWLKFSYMHAFTVQKTDQRGALDSDQVNSSLDRYPYREIVAVEWRMIVDRSAYRRWDMGTRYSYSVPEEGAWLSVDIAYLQGSFTYTLGADVLGAGVAASSSEAGLFSRYRANDRVYAGVGYVF